MKAPTVVTVDDSRVSRRLVGSVAVELGASFVEVADTPDAYRQLSRISGAAVFVVDQVMQYVRWLEIPGLIREKNPDAKTILYTGYPSPEVSERAAAIGVEDWIAKDLRDMAELKDALGTALGRDATGAPMTTGASSNLPGAAEASAARRSRTYAPPQPSLCAARDVPLGKLARVMIAVLSAVVVLALLALAIGVSSGPFWLVVGVLGGVSAATTMLLLAASRRASLPLRLAYFVAAAALLLETLLFVSMACSALGGQ